VQHLDLASFVVALALQNSMAYAQNDSI